MSIQIYFVAATTFMSKLQSS